MEYLAVFIFRSWSDYRDKCYQSMWINKIKILVYIKYCWLVSYIFYRQQPHDQRRDYHDYLILIKPWHFSTRDSESIKIYFYRLMLITIVMHESIDIKNNQNIHSSISYDSVLSYIYFCSRKRLDWTVKLNICSISSTSKVLISSVVIKCYVQCSSDEMMFSAIVSVL